MTRCIREAVALAWVVLWALSTRAGTLLLCGRLSLGAGFPYVRRFADMAPERREAALQRWNRVRWLFPLRIAFAIVKILCHYVFYAMVRRPHPSLVRTVLTAINLGVYSNRQEIRFWNPPISNGRLSTVPERGYC